MKADDIKSAVAAQYFCEGVLNDLVEGIITKDEAFQAMGEYTIKILELAKISELKEINDCKDRNISLHREKRELIGMLESINTIMWESGMIKGRETNVPAIMEVLEKFSSKY